MIPKLQNQQNLRRNSDIFVIVCGICRGLDKKQIFNWHNQPNTRPNFTKIKPAIEGEQNRFKSDYQQVSLMDVLSKNSVLVKRSEFFTGMCYKGCLEHLEITTGKVSYVCGINEMKLGPIILPNSSLSVLMRQFQIFGNFQFFFSSTFFPLPFLFLVSQTHANLIF